MSLDTAIIVAARDEAERIGATLAALGRAFPDAVIWVADDGSRDATAELARAAGARVVSERRRGKGQAMSAAAGRALGESREGTLFVLCDGDLGESAERLRELARAVEADEADLAVAAFARRVGGGLGLAVGFARWAVRRRCGVSARAPISGQRALRAGTLRGLLPFACGYGMELAMTIEAVRAGGRVVEVELELDHRAGGRTFGGFLHRARQLLDFVRVYVSRDRGEWVL
ncbi:MAG TPA: glycosyltransferase family 2 protein [Solirubrobacteraceae bacterium]|nr:glycosyltransferase family 2 protein [Solirubrobacteraceae bacterium]